MKIFVWGTGFAAKELLENELKEIEITGFIDRKAAYKKRLEVGGVKVLAPEEIVGLDYDLILVATGYSQSVYEQARKIGIDTNRLFFIYNNYCFLDLNKNYDLVKGILALRQNVVINSLNPL